MHAFLIPVTVPNLGAVSVDNRPHTPGLHLFGGHANDLGRALVLVMIIERGDAHERLVASRHHAMPGVPSGVLGVTLIAKVHAGRTIENLIIDLGDLAVIIREVVLGLEVDH